MQTKVGEKGRNLRDRAEEEQAVANESDRSEKKVRKQRSEARFQEAEDL